MEMASWRIEPNLSFEGKAYRLMRNKEKVFESNSISEVRKVGEVLMGRECTAVLADRQLRNYRQTQMVTEALAVA